MKPLILLGSLALAALIQPLRCQDLFVDATFGNDANNGSATTPLRSITAAAALASGGQRIVVRPGVYGPVASGETLPIQLGLRAQANLVLEAIGNVVFDLEGSARSALVVLPGAAGTRIAGFVFENGSTAAGAAPVIQGDVDQGAGGFGFLLERCTFRSVYQAVRLNQTVAPLVGCRIQSSLFVGPLTIGIQEDARGAISGICNNTIVGATLAVFSNGDATLVHDNVVTACTVGIASTNTNQTAARFRANDLWGNGIDFHGIATPPGNLAVDPQFADAAGGDFHLRPGSPLIDAGVDTGLHRGDRDQVSGNVDSDLDGRIAPEVGCFEHTPASLVVHHDLANRITIQLQGPGAGTGVLLFALRDGVIQLPGQSPFLLDPLQLVPVVIAGPLPLNLSINAPPVPLGFQLVVQGALVPPTGPLVPSRAVSLWGELLAARTITENFASNAQMDRDASGGDWNGTMQGARIGGDGLHGEFDPAFGVQVGPNSYVWSTDNLRIPARVTLSGRDEVVTDGTFRFATFRIPTGVTVRFAGAHPARIFARGRIVIDGTLDLDAVLQAGYSGANLNGQPGSAGGAGGGSGGKGGDRGNGLGAQQRFSGQPGEDLHLLAGHAYALRAVNTGGRGSPLEPATGLDASAQARFSGWVANVAAGGGGGGFISAGGIGQAVNNGVTPPNGLGGPGGSGIAFNPFPLPANAASLDHFLIGGAGGGGAGTHPFFSFVPPLSWKAGAGGGGGGGALALRAGNDILMAATGVIQDRGGETPGNMVGVIGPAANGGGGSGGSVLLQAGRLVQLLGTIHATGGTGGVTNDPTFSVHTRAGNGGDGYIRLERNPVPFVPELGITLPPSNASNVGPLNDADPVTGSQSLWYWTQQAAIPSFLRYEVEATVAAVPMRFSDDPSRGLLATTGQPVRWYVQGARFNAQGVLIPGTIGPWRRYVGRHSLESALDQDEANAFRFVVLVDRAVAAAIAVTRVGVFYR